MIIDLHSDLLSFLAEQSGRRADDPLSRCSHSQMIAGGVKLQTLALFSKVGADSVLQGERQAEAFKTLLSTPSFAPAARQMASTPLIHLIAACENASVFSLEDEPLSHSLARLEQIQKEVGPIFYISLTWDGENRFGGGVGAKSGLKPDGKALLNFLSGRKIAIDLSHTSDRLATEIIEHIDRANLNTPLIASHSNFRSVHPMPRNLPDAIAREIIRRKGLIGLNLFAPFIHTNDPKKVADHVQHALLLGAQETLCFGADFFALQDFGILNQKYPGSCFFFDDYANASCYPLLLALLTKECALSEKIVQDIAYGNALRFLESFIL